jgi:uncharacterized membrane protein
MATLSVWKFTTPDGAENAEATLLDLQRQELIRIEDAAVVSWPPDEHKPRTSQLHRLAGRGALAGSFWGLLFGLLFFVPLLGAAVGAAAGALSGSLSDVGIDDAFIRKVRDQLSPGTSALFVLSSAAVPDKVRDAFLNREQAELIATNLSRVEEDRLREVFAA